ncbi:MAG: hypothetical protein WDZ38_08360 [Balneolaceae bacterium]
MWILNLFLLSILLLGFFVGKKSYFRLDRLNKITLLNTFLFILILFTVLMLLFVMGYFPQSIAAPFMMTFYSFLTGFFLGYAARLFNFRMATGILLYQHRSFWVDHAPNLLAIILIIYGIYRTALLTDQIVTGIRFTSGISLISFGGFTWMLKVVPEFRSKGVLLLDRFIPWDEILAWRWVSETAIGIEYMANRKNDDERISEFITSVPADEKNELETVLTSKMEEFQEARQKKLFPDLKS